MSKPLSFPLAERCRRLPPYLFASIDAMKDEALARGVDLIDISIGDPDLPTPAPIIERLKSAADDPKNHRYPSYAGLPTFRAAVADWYDRRFNVQLDPAREVVALIGSKEGVGHLPMAFVDAGDVVLYTEPGYPVYPVSAILAGGEPYALPLREERGYLPDLAAVPADVLRRAKLLFINYPNNPTAAEATEEFYAEVVAFARRHGILVCHDAAYTELFFDGYRPPSFLETPGAREVGMEIHSLSKTFNMTGWRLGFAVGHGEAVQGLGKIKSNLDSGAFNAIQEAGITALGLDDDVLAPIRDVYRRRRDVLAEGLRSLGLAFRVPRSTFYLWVHVPRGQDSASFCERLLKEAGVLCTPGNGFGESGEGYIRFALTVPEERLEEAVERIRKVV